MSENIKKAESESETSIKYRTDSFAAAYALKTFAESCDKKVKIQFEASMSTNAPIFEPSLAANIEPSLLKPATMTDEEVK